MSQQQMPPTERTYDQPPSDDEDEDDGDDEDYAEDSAPSQPVMFFATADFNGQEAGDLSFKKGDKFNVLAVRPDGWWMVENGRKQQGLVPSTYLQIYSRYEQVPSPIPARSHQVGSGPIMPQYVAEKDVSDVLESMGALPLGCKPSILYKMMRANPRLSIEYHLLPKLSQTGIGFHDLYWNIEKDKLLKRRVRVLKLFKVLRCENMPTETIDLDVINRYVRFCLFDGVKVLSNIHTIKAQHNKKNPKTWTFLGRLGSNNSCSELGSFFARSNFANNNVKLLVEVGFSFIRTTTKEYGEISAGWSTMPLLTEKGEMRIEADKLYAIKLKGGSPFDKEIQPHPTALAADQSKGNFLQKIVASERVAKVVVRVTAPNQEMLEQLDSGPDTLVWNSLFMPFMFWYRHLAGEKILRQRINDQEGSAVLASVNTLVPDPFLASFPKAATSPQIMDVINILWEDRWKIINKTDKKSTEKLALAFRELFLETGLPLLQTPGLATVHVNPASYEKQTADFKQFVQQYRSDKNCISWLTSKPSAPLDLTQMMVDLSNVYAE